jgi:hypothetical protein
MYRYTHTHIHSRERKRKERLSPPPLRSDTHSPFTHSHSHTHTHTHTHTQGGDPKHNLRPGALLPKADIKNFMLELKEEQNEPLASFARAIATGMGEYINTHTHTHTQQKMALSF